VVVVCVGCGLVLEMSLRAWRCELRNGWHRGQGRSHWMRAGHVISKSVARYFVGGWNLVDGKLSVNETVSTDALDRAVGI
jgi:hypothetical protein